MHWGLLLGLPALVRHVAGGFLLAGWVAGGSACAQATPDPVVLNQPSRISPNACSIQNPVQLGSLSGGSDRVIAIAPPALLDRYMTGPLTGWEAELRVAAIYHLDQTVVSLVNASSYACRYIRGSSGRLSNHGRGLALDVSGFKMADGRTIRVEDQWGKNTPEGRFLRAAHKAACRNFNIVLGPSYNQAHRNHFHVDMGRGGAFCR